MIFIYITFIEFYGKNSDYSYLNRLIDTNCIAKAISSNIECDNTDFTLWQFKLQNYREKGLKTNLKFLCEKYNIDFDPSKLHDALYDIEKTLKSFSLYSGNTIYNEKFLL